MIVESEERAVRLASIVAIDVAGFSTMSERDQLKAAGKIEALRKRIEAVATRNGGRVFNTAGDGFMLEFGSAGSSAPIAAAALTIRPPRSAPPTAAGPTRPRTSPASASASCAVS